MLKRGRVDSPGRRAQSTNEMVVSGGNEHARGRPGLTLQRCCLVGKPASSLIPILVPNTTPDSARVTLYRRLTIKHPASCQCFGARRTDCVLSPSGRNERGRHGVGFMFSVVITVQCTNLLVSPGLRALSHIRGHSDDDYGARTPFRDNT